MLKTRQSLSKAVSCRCASYTVSSCSFLQLKLSLPSIFLRSSSTKNKCSLQDDLSQYGRSLLSVGYLFSQYTSHPSIESFPSPNPLYIQQTPKPSARPHTPMGYSLVENRCFLIVDHLSYRGPGGLPKVKRSKAALTSFLGSQKFAS